jgi:hypothetical protein
MSRKAWASMSELAVHEYVIRLHAEGVPGTRVHVLPP